MEVCSCYLPDVSSIILAAGSGEGAEKIPPKMKDVDIQVKVIPEIGYKTEVNDPAPDKIVKLLLKNLPHTNSFWWVHNYHLGKNPAFTEALLRIADTHKNSRIILHIHDFPECGRFENMEIIKKKVSLPLYPVQDNIRYAVINKRDYDILIKSGLPEKTVFELSNPVETKTNKKDVQANSSLGNRLFKKFGKTFPNFDPALPIIMYPVRCIRRKNVLEAVLLTVLHQELNLLVTLPGVSKQERTYSELTESVFRRGMVKGIFGIGASEESGINFSELTTAVSGIISTSIMEGFGYQFIEPILWQKPLFARSLDILNGMEQLWQEYPAFFYNNLKVPIANTERKNLLSRYKRRLKKMSSILPEKSVTKIAAEIPKRLEAETVDFADLDPDTQVKKIESAQDPAFRQELRGINENIIGSYFPGPFNEPVRNLTLLERQYGYEPYSRKIENVLHSFSKEDVFSIKKSQKEIETNIVTFFAKPEYLRPLYEPYNSSKF